MENPTKTNLQQLSLWQSVVEEHFKKESALLKSSKGKPLPIQEALRLHIAKAENLQGEHPEFRSETNDSTVEELSQISELTFEIAIARILEAHEHEQQLLAEYRKFSNLDPGFLTCADTYWEYYKKYKGKLKYNSWKVEGKKDLNYGRIKHKLKNDAKIAIIGDWGTGMEDAEYLLETLVRYNKPDLIIHLGDIYYSGTNDECIANFENVIKRVFTRTLGNNKRIPVLSIPGNHDYYAFGYDYYKMIARLNNYDPELIQHASYFCIETENKKWQFIGADSGYDDANPINQINTFYAGPNLHKDEAEWHIDKIKNFSGQSILFTHHQLFSHNSKINGSASVHSAYPNLNKYLLDIFQPYFDNKIAAWFWGHEHNQVIYQDSLFGLNKGRLIGASAFEELHSEDPYKINYEDTPYDDRYKLAKKNGYFNHGYAIIDLGNEEGNKPMINYYQYPSWGKNRPNPIPTKPILLNQESLSPATPPNAKKIDYGQKLYISLENGLNYIGNNEKHILTYYPRVTLRKSAFKFNGGIGTVKHGDTLQIVTCDPKTGTSNVLGAWKSTKTLYYAREGYKEQTWIVHKADYDGTNPEIKENDPVYFINRHFRGQFLCPYVSASNTYLSTDARFPSKWFLKLKS